MIGSSISSPENDLLSLVGHDGPGRVVRDDGRPPHDQRDVRGLLVVEGNQDLRDVEVFRMSVVGS